MASFIVADIDQTVRDLKARGVAFEDYNFPDFKTIDSIATLASEKAAWFKDTEGNILAVSQLLG